MDPYAKLEINKNKYNIYNLSFNIIKNKLTTMNFACLIDDFENKLKILNNDKISKFIMIYDMNNMDYNINNSQINEITSLFKKNKTLFENKLLATFIIANDTFIKTFIKLFKSIYTPMKPLFMNTEIDSVIENLINNKPNEQEYIL